MQYPVWIAAIILTAGSLCATPAWAADPAASAVSRDTERAARQELRDMKMDRRETHRAQAAENKQTFGDIRRKCQDGDKKACEMIRMREAAMKNRNAGDSQEGMAMENIRKRCDDGNDRACDMLRQREEARKRQQEARERHQEMRQERRQIRHDMRSDRRPLRQDARPAADEPSR